MSAVELLVTDSFFGCEFKATPDGPNECGGKHRALVVARDRELANRSGDDTDQHPVRALAARPVLVHPEPADGLEHVSVLEWSVAHHARASARYSKRPTRFGIVRPLGLACAVALA